MAEKLTATGKYAKYKGFKWLLGDENVPALGLLVDDYSKILMDDCTWKHHWDKEENIPHKEKIQIVPNKLDITWIGQRDSLKDVLQRIMLGGP